MRNIFKIYMHSAQGTERNRGFPSKLSLSQSVIIVEQILAYRERAGLFPFQLTTVRRVKSELHRKLGYTADVF